MAKMGMVFKIYILTSIVLSYVSSINQNEYLDSELELPSEYESNKQLSTHHTSCPRHSEPVDCAEVFENGFKSSGVYRIYPKNNILPCGEIKVYCDMKTDGGGWTVIQRRGDFKRPSDYFYKSWKEYKIGFGNLRKDFWLGNDIIYVLTNQKKYSVRFDLGVANETAYAAYDKFWIKNEEKNYQLYIADYSGTAGNSMIFNHDEPFSTNDRKNNPSAIDCAKTSKGGWWYYGTQCAQGNLNGLYLKGHKELKIPPNATVWDSWKGYKVSLTDVEIKIRPHDFETS